MSWFKVNVNEVLCTGLTNSELGLMLRYKALCEHFRVKDLTWEQVCFNFVSKERKTISKMFGIMPDVKSESGESKSKVSLKCTQSKSNVDPIYTQSKSKVSLKSDSKNSDLACARIYNKINNNINNKTRQDKTRLNHIVVTCFVKQAERLGEIVQNQKNIKINQSKINSWAKSLEQLHRIEGVNPDRIDKALEWYSENAGGEYVPVVESGKSFREKFVKLENQMKKTQAKTSSDDEFWHKLEAM